MKKIITTVGLVLLTSPIAYAQSNLYREDAPSTGIYIPANSSTLEQATLLDENGNEISSSAETFTLNGSKFTIPEGIVTTADGTVLTSAQVTRLQDIIDNDMQEFLELTISATVPLVAQKISSGFSENEIFSLPKALVINQTADFTFQPVTYSNDSDTARFVGQSIQDGTLTTLYDSGHVNWSSEGWVTGGALRTVSVTFPAGADSVKFWGGCNRAGDGGNICSAQINQAYITFNPDLPAYGEQITVEPSS
jgi:hypothetical protein